MPFATAFPALKEIPFSILLFKMGHLAGVVENSPQMRDEKLATSHGREELLVRFAKLPPLIETSLVGRKSSIPEKVVQENKEKGISFNAGNAVANGMCARLRIELSCFGFWSGS